MKNLIICEGGTDLTLIQYFMEKVHNWNYESNKGKSIKITEEFKCIKHFKRGYDILSIGAAGGCTVISKCFDEVIMKNRYSALDDEFIDNIIIISDRDEIDSEEHFINNIEKMLIDRQVTITDSIENDKWLNCNCKNGRNQDVSFNVLILIIPFEETGALETFLLKSISDNDSYDKMIISKIDDFVDKIDEDKKYLNKRRYKTKAKFDVYFSIRTPLEQFQQRRSILRNIDWENYKTIQNSFEKLGEF